MGMAGVGEHCRAMRQHGRVPCGVTAWGHLWNLTYDRRLNRRNLVHVSQMHQLQFSSLPCSSVTTLGKLRDSKLETLNVLTRTSISQPITSLQGPPLPSLLPSPLPRHCGCPHLAGLAPLCRQCHRQPLGCVSPSISGGWQAPGPHPALAAAGIWEWLWVRARREVRG